MTGTVSPRTAVFAGSFSPPTLGHLDIIERGARLYDRLVVAVMANPEKKYLYSPELRVSMLKKCTVHLSNVTVLCDGGLLIDLAAREGAGVILRGVRGADDIGYETQLAVSNRRLTGVETVFLPSSPEHMHLSSTIVNGYAMYGADLTGMVPEAIIADVLAAQK